MSSKDDEAKKEREWKMWTLKAMFAFLFLLFAISSIVCIRMGISQGKELASWLSLAFGILSGMSFAAFMVLSFAKPKDDVQS